MICHSTNINPLQLVWNSQFNSILDNLTEEILRNPSVEKNVVFLTLTWESPESISVINNLNKLVNNLKKYKSDLSVIIFCNSWYDQEDFNKIFNKNYQVVFVDYFLLLMYYRIFEKKESDVSKSWNPLNKNFLFLTGKPYKKNRIGLLYEYYKKNLLKDCVWSLFYQEEFFQLIIDENIINQSKSEVEFFYKNYQNNPDNINANDNNLAFHYNGVPYNVDLYKNSLFQVVSETDFLEQKPSPWVTEKTWLPIINRLPFIIAGPPMILEKLSSRGFKTFSSYLIENYDTIVDPEQRLMSIVLNSEYWLNNLKNYKNEIQHDVDHNFSKFIEIVNENISKIKRVSIHYGYTDYTQVIHLDDVYNKSTKVNHNNIKSTFPWNEWYNTIKADHWPDCENESDFKKLPREIQEECIKVFKYKPF
jgi:hypothetical protein